MMSQLLVVVSAAVLLLLIYNVKYSQSFNFYDHRLHQRLIRDRSGFSWKVVAFLYDPKLVVVWTVLLASYYLQNNYFDTAFWILGTIGLADGIGVILKRTVKRKRPFAHLTVDEGYSFPSGHVLSATTLMLILLRLFSVKFGLYYSLAMVILWIMVIISRLSLKAHYPSDVLGATSLAIFCFFLVNQLIGSMF